MSKILNNLVTTLPEEDFRELVKVYTMQKYKTKDVRIVDGPWDGGNDLEIYRDNKDIKHNIQVTVQKINFENKLKKDLEKSRDNVAKFNYQSKLDFYINQNVSKDKKNELETEAEIDYGITLRIYDGNFFGEEIEKDDHLVALIYKMHDINSGHTTLVDNGSKVVFDVLTHNSDTVEIKKNFISSFIYSFLFTNPESSSDEIYENINPLLNNSLEKSYFEQELNYLRLKQYVIANKETKKHKLSKEKYDEISKLYNDVSSQETILILEIENFLREKNIEVDLDELLTFLYKIYQENYNIDIIEVTESTSSYSNSLRKSFDDLNSFFTKNNVSQESVQELSRCLLEICSQNNFLNKLSAVYLFTNLFNSDKLEKYINSRQQKIFFDTQILIRLLCVISVNKYNFKDIALKSVRTLFDTLKQYKNKLELYTSVDYIDEVSNHMIDAIKLKRFLELPYIHQLGTSKNVFYNAYVELSENKQLSSDVSLLDFISDLVDIEQIELESFSPAKLQQNIQKKILEILTFLEFKVIRHEPYSNFQKIKKDYEMELAISAKFRSLSAISNDVRTILYLSNPDYHINENGHIDEPYLVTWDTTFQSIRKTILSEPLNGASFWYIYSPMKLVDRLSVMNFNLKPESINSNIIALTETNFNLSGRKSSFIDVISSFFNKEDLSELHIIKKLAHLNSQTQESESVQHDDFTDEAESTLIKVLIQIKNHYTADSDYHFKDLINAFETKELENNILEILGFGLQEGNMQKMYEEFNKLISSENTSKDKSRKDDLIS
ncbi:hypothetical protein [Flavobacterium phycosphaerae]|uniref:hypothetical protein n=1 Tax=Flavobacterium phycosphaerae TaxID=2697515 RepID=UPI0013897240|nr:hypothetical protein [Flavobacterium phycosphaerae]